MRLLPGGEVLVEDSSLISGNTTPVRIGVQARTTRGQVNAPYKISTWAEFGQKLGAVSPGSDEGNYIKRLLQTGIITLYVSRAGHFTDASDKTTAAGAAATGNITASATGETRATGTAVFTGGGAGASVGSITVSVFRQSGPGFIFPAVEIPANSTATQTAAAIANTLNTLYGFGFSNTAGTLTLTAPVGSGVDANTWILQIGKTGLAGGTAVGIAITQFASGVSGVLAGNLTITAKGPGTGYNGLVLSISKAASKNIGFVDLVVSEAGKKLDERKDLPQAITTLDLTALSNSLETISLSLASGSLPIGSVALSGGTFDNATVVAADVAGSFKGKTCLYSFGAVQALDYIANLDFPDRVVDLALVEYQRNRPNFRFFVRAPKNLTEQGILDYRNGTGAYTGAPFDSFGGDLIGTWYREKDIVTGQIREVSAITDVLIARAKTDIKAGKWESHSGFGDGGNTGYGFGSLQNPAFYDMPQNLYDQGLGLIVKEIYDSGVGMVIVHPAFGPCVWYDRTLYKNTTSLLRKHKTAQLCLHLIQVMSPILEKRTFRAADPIIWREIYREAKLEIQVLETGKNGFPPAIEAGENVNWYWLGDQNVPSKSNAVYNNQDDLDAGRYTARFPFKPIGSMEFLTMVLSVYDSNSFKIAFE